MKVEQAFLGTLIKNNYLIRDTALTPSHLERPQHQLLLKTMQDLTRDGKSVDVAIVSVSVDVESIGGVSYLNDLLAMSNPKKFDDYENIILDAWKEREKKNILVKAQEEDWDIEKINESLELLNQSKSDDLVDIKDLMVEMYEMPWEEKTLNNQGIKTGISKFDRMTDGFKDSELTIIAGRPSMGKSDVMLHIAKEAGFKHHLPIVFSLEMPARSLASRLTASIGMINRLKLRDPYNDLSEEQKKRWGSVTGKVAETNIKMFDDSIQTVPDMRAKVRKLMNDNPGMKPIIIIDYLQLITPRNYYNGNANLQVTEISKDLKRMARDLNCPVIALSQLSRDVESRQDKRPVMSDIRDSGAVEQDADVIIFLYRDDYYNKDENPEANQFLEWIIAKQRNGPIGTVETYYNKFTGVIRDVNYTRSVS